MTPMATAKSLKLPDSGVRLESGAPLIKRVISLIIDLTALNFAVFYPFRRLTLGFMSEGQGFRDAVSAIESDPALAANLSRLSLAVFSLVFAYFLITQAAQSQTLGQMIMKIYVRSDRKDGKLSFWSVFVRNLFVFPFFPLILFWVFDPIFMIVTRTNQRLLELLSKTRTVEQVVV